jgi:hypoxanthine phosphoribosyltransferase
MRQVISQFLIIQAMKRMADEISSRYRLPCEGDRQGSDEVPVIIGVLSGGAITTCDLVRLLTIPSILGWVQVQSYKGTSKFVHGPLPVHLLLDMDVNLTGRQVVVVDDILETGATMSEVVRHISRFDPLSIETAVLLRKHAVVPRMDVDYVGFDVPDEFFIGSGLDIDGRFRHLAGVWVQ